MSTIWQNMIVYLIVAGCVAWVLWRVFHSIRQSREGVTLCAGCTKPCEIKQQFEEKQRSCARNVKKTKKTCCD